MKPLLAAASATVVFALGALPAQAETPPRRMLIDARGTLTITESRCEAGALGGCGHVRLESRFASGVAPAVHGLSVSGTGFGICESLSPSAPVMSPGGSQQIIDGALRLVPGRFSATRVALQHSARGLRWTWLEPLAPSIACSYFDESRTLAVPLGTHGLSSPWLGPAALRARRVVVPISGSARWMASLPDGTTSPASAQWRLRLVYTTRKTPRFVG